MIHFLKRHFAMRSYFWRLSQELSRRFGKKSYYSINEVSMAAEKGRFSMTFLAHAHAMFCSRGDFEARYGSSNPGCTYDALRAVIGRRFFGGATGFDAMNILRLSAPPMEREYSFTQNADID